MKRNQPTAARCYRSQTFWKSVLEGLRKMFWSLHEDSTLFNSHYHVMAVIFAVPTLKTWECIPKSVSLKYKTAILTFLLTLVPVKALGKRLAVNVFYLSKYRLLRKWDSVKGVLIGPTSKIVCHIQNQVCFPMLWFVPLWIKRTGGKKTLKLCTLVIIQFIWTW